MSRRYGGNVDTHHGKIRDTIRSIYGMWAEDMSAAGKGFPDLMVGGVCQESGNPKVVLAEVKSKGGKLRTSQVEFKERWSNYMQIIVAYKVSDILVQGFGWDRELAESLD